MRLSAVAILLAGCAVNGFNFPYGNGKNIEQRHPHVLKARTTTLKLSTNANQISMAISMLSLATSSTKGLAIPFTSSTNSSAAQLPSSHPPDGKIPNTFGSTVDYTTTHPTVSISVTAIGPQGSEGPVSISSTQVSLTDSSSITSSLETSTALGEIDTGSPSNVESTSMLLSITTSDGHPIVIATPVVVESTPSVSVITSTQISTAQDQTTIFSSLLNPTGTSSIAETAQSASETFTEASTPLASSSTTSVLISTIINTVIASEDTTTVTSLLVPVSSITTPIAESAQAPSSTSGQDVGSGSEILSMVIETSSASDDFTTITSSLIPASTASNQKAGSSILSATLTIFTEATIPQQTTSTTESVTQTSVIVSTVTQISTDSGGETTITKPPMSVSTSFVAQSEVQGTSTTTTVDSTSTVSVTQTGETPAQTTVSVTKTTGMDLTTLTSISISTVTSPDTQQHTSEVAPATDSGPSLSPQSGTVVSLPTPTPSIAQTSGVYNFVGCFTEGYGQRALQGSFLADDSLTIASCTADCYPFLYAGVEFGRECWCGDSLKGGASGVANLECSMPCSGDSGEACGASSRLAIYQWNGTSTENPASSSQSGSSTSQISSITAPPSSQSDPSTIETSQSSIASTDTGVFITSAPSSQQTSSATTVQASSFSADQNSQASTETTTISGQSITLSFTLPQSTTTEVSLATTTAYSNIGSASACTSGSHCICPAQVTVTVTQIKTYASNTILSAPSSHSTGHSSATTRPSLSSPSVVFTGEATLGHKGSSLAIMLGLLVLMLLV